MAYQTVDHGSSHGHHFAFSNLATVGHRSVEAVLTWLDRYRSRNELLRLDDHMLKDIGLSSADVELEAGKRFWQA